MNDAYDIVGAKLQTSRKMGRWCSKIKQAKVSRMNPYLWEQPSINPQKMNPQEILEAIRSLSVEEQFWLLRKTLLIILKSEQQQELHGVAQESAEEYQDHRSEGVYTEQEIEFFIARLVAVLRRPEERQKLLNILAVFYSDDSVIVRLAGHEHESHNFFDSAGILAHWTIDGAQLRKDAWRRRD